MQRQYVRISPISDPTGFSLFSSFLVKPTIIFVRLPLSPCGPVGLTGCRNPKSARAKRIRAVSRASAREIDVVRHRSRHAALSVGTIPDDPWVPRGIETCETYMLHIDKLASSNGRPKRSHDTHHDDNECSPVGTYHTAAAAVFFTSSHISHHPLTFSFPLPF